MFKLVRNTSCLGEGDHLFCFDLKNAIEFDLDIFAFDLDFLDLVRADRRSSEYSG
jgi:hypothetical protein